jgi:hypothetical protein
MFNKNDLIILEEELIKKYNSLSPNGYNICPLGTVRKYSKMSPEAKLKISNSLKGRTRTPEHQAKLSKSRKDNFIKSKEFYDRMEYIRSFKKDVSDETKLKISNKLKIRPLEIRKRAADKMRGRVVSEETKMKQSAAMKGKPKSLETREKISKSMSGKKLSEETKRRMSNSRKEYFNRKRIINENLIKYDCA